MGFSLKFLQQTVGGAAIFAALGGLPAKGQDMPLSQVLIPGEDWKVAAEGFEKYLHGPTTDRDGGVLFEEKKAEAIRRFGPDGKLTLFRSKISGVRYLTIGPKGTLFVYGETGARRLENADPQRETQIADGGIRGLVPTRDGGFYVARTSPKSGPFEEDQLIIHHMPASGRGEIEVAAISTSFGGALALSPDGGTLVAADDASTSLWAYRVAKNGRLSGEAPYYGPLLAPAWSPTTIVSGLTFDRDGRLYAATMTGIQVFDPTGRPCGTILSPGKPWSLGVTFGGADRNELFTIGEDKLYRRRTKVRGPTWPGE